MKIKILNSLIIISVDRVTSRRKQISANEEKNNEIRELEKVCEQLRKVNTKHSSSNINYYYLEC